MNFKYLFFKKESTFITTEFSIFYNPAQTPWNQCMGSRAQLVSLFLYEICHSTRTPCEAQETQLISVNAVNVSGVVKSITFLTVHHLLVFVHQTDKLIVVVQSKVQQKLCYCYHPNCEKLKSCSTTPDTLTYQRYSRVLSCHVRRCRFWWNLATRSDNRVLACFFKQFDIRLHSTAKKMQSRK